MENAKYSQERKHLKAPDSVLHRKKAKIVHQPLLGNKVSHNGKWLNLLIEACKDQHEAAKMPTESEEENCCRCSEHLAQGDTIVSPASSPRSPIKVKKTRLLTATGSPQDLLRRDVRRESEQTPPRAVLELTVMMEGAINSWCGCGCGCNSIATIPKTEEPSLLPEEGPEEAHEEKRLRCAQASTTRRLKKNSVVWGTTIPFLIILFIGIFTACLTG
ncbi:uncharacterized protein [Hyperolius riggenbachi]|uniref:uncharacterized protein isoform X3 n=1 Tax=Hyperolius riggenbachi TaxID=752182 RepID=UPI0035A2CBC9